MRNLGAARGRALRGLALVAALLVGLTACAAPKDDALGVTRVEVAQDLVRLDDSLATPLAPGLESAGRLELGGIPLATDDAVIGLADADESSHLSMAAITSAGEPNWQIETSPTCTAYAVTSVDGVDIAVFMDARAGTGESGMITETVASAFRVDDGEQLWGPMPVPGPLLQDSGLVFYAPKDAPIADVSDTAVIVDPKTGEQRVSAADDGVEIRGEFNGVGLISGVGAGVKSPGLRAVQLSDMAELWREAELERPSGVGAEAVFRAASLREAALAGVLFGTWLVDGEDVGQAAAYSLATGELLTPVLGVLQHESAASETTAYAVSRTQVGDVVVAVDAVEGTSWQAPVPDGATLIAAGDGAVYLRLGGFGLVLSAVDGIEVASGDFRVPEHVFADGSALISTAGELWLAARSNR